MFSYEKGISDLAMIGSVVVHVIAALKESSEFSHFLAKVHRCGPPQIGDLSPMCRNPHFHRDALRLSRCPRVFSLSLFPFAQMRR